MAATDLQTALLLFTAFAVGPGVLRMMLTPMKMLKRSCDNNYRSVHVTSPYDSYDHRRLPSHMYKEQTIEPLGETTLTDYYNCMSYSNMQVSL